METEELRKKYRLKYDYHTHTIYSKVGPYKHGKGTIRDNIKAAYDKGLRDIAITDHGPREFYGLKTELIPKMREEIQLAKQDFPGMKVWLGVEANIMNSTNGIDIDEQDKSKYDFINAGYHYGVPKCEMIANWIAFHLPCTENFKEKRKHRNTKMIVRALRRNNINILTHPGDKAFFDMDEIAKVCEETGTLLEINAKHKRPNLEDLKIFAKYDTKFVLGSDAHKPERVGTYLESLKLALDAGISPERIVNVEER